MSLRAEYEAHGVTEFYRKFGDRYRNPHAERVAGAFREAVGRWKLPLGRVLDLACGSGEISEPVKLLGGSAVGCDPYCGRAYTSRTGKVALDLSFEQIAKGALRSQGGFTLLVCSYALHLLDPSWLPELCRQLAYHSERFVVLTPHKRPNLQHYWALQDEFVLDGVRARYYDRT